MGFVVHVLMHERVNDWLGRFGVLRNDVGSIVPFAVVVHWCCWAKLNPGGSTCMEYLQCCTGPGSLWCFEIGCERKELSASRWKKRILKCGKTTDISQGYALTAYH